MLCTLLTYLRDVCVWYVDHSEVILKRLQTHSDSVDVMWSLWYQKCVTQGPDKDAHITRNSKHLGDVRDPCGSDVVPDVLHNERLRVQAALPAHAAQAVQHPCTPEFM